MSNQGKLSYSKSRPRRIAKKDLLIVILGLTAIVLAVQWKSIRQLYITTQAYRAQRAAMRYQLPSNHTIFTNDYDAARQLRAADPTYIGRDGYNYVFYAAPPWVQMVYWRVYDHPAAPGGEVHNGTLFLHARRSKAGQRLIVVESFAFPAPSGSIALSLYVDVIHPGTPFTMWTRPTPKTPTTPALVLQMSLLDDVTLYAAQPDPADESHFTFTFKHNATSGTVDGWLRDDGTVDLKPRGGAVREFDGYNRWFPSIDAAPNRK